MKARIALLLMCFLLAACNAGGASALTMQTFKDAFEADGIEVNLEEKPMFEMIGAEDGVIFYNELNPVKIYQFADKKALEAVKDTLPAAKNWEQKELFLLETKDQQAKDIFNSVE